MRIFIAATSLRIEYGGPAYSVARLAESLAVPDNDVALWCADDEHDVRILRNAGGLVTYSGRLEAALAKFGRPDVIHDNGIWLRHNHRIARAAAAGGVPRVVSPRGMLEPWAMRHKRLKKGVAWRLYQRRDLRAASALHASTPAEAANIARHSLGVPVTIVRNGVDVPVRSAARNGENGKTAVFLGRIYPVKGLPMLIDAWNAVRPSGWRLKIAGPDEAGHRQQLENQIDRAGLRDVISFTGAVAGEGKRDLLFSSDLFVLPTHSESFGMAIAEAFAHGLPVLTTTSAPWPMIEEERMGWLALPSVDGIAAKLREAVSVAPDGLRAMGERGRDFVAAGYAWTSVAQDFIQLYERVAGAGR